MRRLGAVCLIAMLAGATARAQGIDCTRARSPTEKAICASPTLHTLDGQVAGAYADALARQPDAQAAMRADLLRWLKARDAACNVPADALERCLAGQLTSRLAALAPPPALPSAAPPPAVASAAPPADPALPGAAFNPPAPAATVDAASLPAAAEADTLLHVISAGRFAVSVRSPGGTALQLVDIVTGPTERAGIPGAQDGRLDRLLDVGTYKLRLFSAPGATGLAAITVLPFHDAAPPAALPGAGRTFTTTLRDGEQRAFWLLVPPGDGPNVRIEAAGRAVADLRLFRHGRELTALEPERLRVDSTPARPLDDLRLVGRVEPGTYLAVAYGGPALPWTDGAPDQPFHLRAGASPALAEGFTGGAVGPFGSEVFALPRWAGLVRLDLPAPAPAELRVGDAVGVLAKNSREPHTTLHGPGGEWDVAELRAAAGQPYTLRSEDRSTATEFSRPGTWWVAASTAGTGADELPPTLVLQQTDPRGRSPRLVASTAPRIGGGSGPGDGWHARFNLRGPSSLLVQFPSGGDMAFRSTGVPIRHGQNRSGTLPPDLYRLELEPQAGALGSLEVMLGATGAAPPPVATPLPADPVIPLGTFTLTQGQSLILDSGTGPGVTAGLVARRVPVALAEGPLIATVATGDSLSVPVQLAPGGSLAVSELGVGSIPFGRQDDGSGGRTTVVVPLADHPRTVALAWRRDARPAAAIPAPPLPGTEAALAAGVPSYLDLRRGEERGFALSVAEGGLFRVETLGRLHTAGRVATPFIPALAAADGNGAGANMLVQSALRAGRYRVDVRAVDSAGHLGLLASPAPLLTGSTLRAGGSVRASLPAGSGVAFPMEVTGGADDRYRLDVLSLGAPWTGRLEDAEGWPVVTPGKLDGLEVGLRPGGYRLVLTPDAVARQAVARLTRLGQPAPITGHGPHALPFEAAQSATWREPDGPDRPRDPDRWTFSLPGRADISVTLADGMVGTLHRADDDAVTARVVRRWSGTLDAGDWRVDVASLGRNDRLPYTVALASPDLQPGAPRMVTLPASLPFDVAQPRVATVLSWGGTPVKATLRGEDGRVVARFGARADDWNLGWSRALPAGRYTLDVQAASPPDLHEVSGPNAPASDDDTAEGDDQDAQTAATTGAVAAAASSPAAVPDSVATTDDAPPTPAEQADAPKVVVSLYLPPDLPPVPAAAELSGDGVHLVDLPQPAAGALVVAGVRAAAPVVLALERQGSDGWHTVATATGLDPAVAAPADADTAPWRVAAWALDGGDATIRLAARAVELPMAEPGSVSLTAIDGMPAPLAAARVRLPSAGLAAVSAAPGLLAGGWPGHALSRPGPAVVAAGPELWLLAPRAASVTATLLPVPPGGVTLDLAAGLAVALPAPEGLQLWRAESGAGQPSLGAGSGVAASSAVGLARAGAVLRGDGMRVRLSALAPTLLSARAVEGALDATVPPGGALPLSLPAGDKAVQLNLAPGLAAFAGWHDPAPVTVWGGAAGVSRDLAGAWTELLLVNMGADPAAAHVAAQPASPAATLRPGAVLKRFYGAAGSFDMPFEAPPGSRLIVAGGGMATVVTDAAVLRGADVPVAGPGRAVVEHGAGAVAVWLDAPGASPWPVAAVQHVTTPARVPLTGDAATLALDADGPVLLHLTTAVPVLAGLGTAPPELFPAGAELHRAVPAGPVSLRLFSATDAPMGGEAAVWAEPLRPLGEGLGESVAVTPGGAAAWRFTVAKAGPVGIGVRAEPDTARVRLLNEHGEVVGEGVAQLAKLQPGNYVLEVRVPADAAPTVVRPALVGVTPPGNGPPPDVAAAYLELVGAKRGGTP